MAHLRFNVSPRVHPLRRLATLATLALYLPMEALAASPTPPATANSASVTRPAEPRSVPADSAPATGPSISETTAPAPTIEPSTERTLRPTPVGPEPAHDQPNLTFAKRTDPPALVARQRVMSLMTASFATLGTGAVFLGGGVPRMMNDAKASGAAFTGVGSAMIFTGFGLLVAAGRTKRKFERDPEFRARMEADADARGVAPVGNDTRSRDMIAKGYRMQLLGGMPLTVGVAMTGLGIVVATAPGGVDKPGLLAAAFGTSAAMTAIGAGVVIAGRRRALHSGRYVRTTSASRATLSPAVGPKFVGLSANGRF